MALSMTQARWVTYERRMARSSASKCFEKCRTLLYLQDYIQKKQDKTNKGETPQLMMKKRASKFIEGTSVSSKLFSPHSDHAIPLEIKLS